MRLVAAGLLLLVATAASAERPKLDMLAFFTGKTHAHNVLKVVLKRPVPLIVDSIGGKGDRGDFVLIETVREGDKPPRQRKWIVRPAGPNRFSGSLSDAVSPLDIQIDGDTARIRYVMKGGLKVDQELRLQPDGKSLTNHVSVKKLGMRFARVEGAVRKLD